MLFGLVVALGAVLALRDWRAVGERVVVSAASAPSPVARAGLSRPLTVPVAAPASTSATPRVLADDEAELCGFGIVKRAELERPDSATRFFPDLKEKGDQWVANMRSSHDEAVRAVGHYIAAALSWAPASPSLRERVEACDGKAECMTQELSKAMLGGSPATREIDALVDEATTTNNPLVYAMAVQACGAKNKTSKRGRCQLITLDRWTQIDGDNLVPWLFRAGAAEAQGDAAGRTEALYRASISSASRIAGKELLPGAAVDAKRPN